jgi:ferredoxin
MADKTQKVSENVSGRFYVDGGCIQCGNCAETAPDNFAQGEDGGYICCKQPENNADELYICLQAMNDCPVDAIGDDGE